MVDLGFLSSRLRSLRGFEIVDGAGSNGKSMLKVVPEDGELKGANYD